MPHPSPDQSDHRQSAIARGMMLAHRTTSMTMSLIVPTLAGYWADQKWGTSPWLITVGAVIGFPLFMYQLVAFAATSGSESRTRKSADDNSSA